MRRVNVDDSQTLLTIDLRGQKVDFQANVKPTKNGKGMLIVNIAKIKAAE